MSEVGLCLSNIDNLLMAVIFDLRFQSDIISFGAQVAGIYEYSGLSDQEIGNQIISLTDWRYIL